MRWFGLGCGGLLTVTLLCGLLGLLQPFTSLPSKVFLVNGLSHPYTAVIDGVRYPLAPHERLEVELIDGRHTVSIEDLDAKPIGGVPFVQAVGLDEQFADLPVEVGSGQVCAINPDRAAVIELIEYHHDQWEDRKKACPRTYTRTTGRLVTCYSDVIEAFERPDTPTLSFTPPPDGRVLDRILYGDTTGEAFQRLIDEGESRENVLWLTRMRALLNETVDPRPLSIALDFRNREEQRELLQTRLSDRPLSEDFHYYYSDRFGGTEEAIDFYARAVAAEPDSKRLRFFQERATDADRE